jgi:hypothetical protein
LESFEVSAPTVYRYLSFYHLIKEYPNILLFGLMVIDLSKYRKKIEEAVKKDTELSQLLKHGFRGIRVNFKLGDPTFDPNDIKHININE